VNVPNTVVAEAAAPREPKEVTELMHLMSNLATSITIGKLCERNQLRRQRRRSRRNDKRRDNNVPILAAIDDLRYQIIHHCSACNFRCHCREQPRPLARSMNDDDDKSSNEV
jgi:hypothetical protein